MTGGPTAEAPAAADWTLPGGRRFSTVLAGLAHFAGQALGFALALLVSLLVARKLGAGTETDAFFLSRRVITGVIETLNRILVVFYIPLIAADAALNSRGFRRAFARRLLIAGLGGCGLAALFILSAPWIVATLAPDFPEAGRRLATQVLAVFGAALPATMISVAFAAFLNVAGRFGAPSSIRQFPRAAIVATLLLASGALAVKAALAFTLGWYWWRWCSSSSRCRCSASTPWTIMPSPESAPAAARRAAHGTALVLMVLGAFASTWLETYFAAEAGPAGSPRSSSASAWARCSPTPSPWRCAGGLPRWSRAAGSGAAGSGVAGSGVGSGGLPAEAGRLGSTVVVGLCLLAPVQVFFFVNSGALVDALLDHGRFDAEAARAVAEAIRWMALAPLSAFVLRLVVVRIIVEPGIPVTAWVALGVAADVAAKLALLLADAAPRGRGDHARAGPRAAAADRALPGAHPAAARLRRRLRARALARAAGRRRPRMPRADARRAPRPGRSRRGRARRHARGALRPGDLGPDRPRRNRPRPPNPPRPPRPRLIQGYG